MPADRGSAFPERAPEPPVSLAVVPHSRHDDRRDEAKRDPHAHRVGPPRHRGVAGADVKRDRDHEPGNQKRGDVAVHAVAVAPRYLRRTRVPRIFWLLSALRKFGTRRSISSKYDDSAGV